MTTPKLKIILTGQRFGSLEVLSFAGMGSNSNAVWRCRCDCGIEKNILGNNLRRGIATTCGCGRIKAITKHGHAGDNNPTPEYSSWDNMIQRCTNPKSASCQNYGARGITICDRWLDFQLFLEDMGPKPTPKHSLDRIDSRGNYEPGNCRWATMKEQINNPSNRPSRGQKLNPQDVREIRQRADGGESASLLAADYAVTTKNIQRIIKRRSWANVT